MSEAFRFGMNKNGSGTCYLETGHRDAPSVVTVVNFAIQMVVKWVHVYIQHSDQMLTVLTVSIVGGSRCFFWRKPQ